MKKKRNPISKIGAKEKKIETRSDCDATFTDHDFGGGLLVNASISVGSCPVIYEASTFVAPFIEDPDFKIACIF
ncbi:unannotated protein [freshwater metagenome]|uniref:Unannotated protein n=1 Tax=freshwater metagenome TaxID=449393 RepID=A0A6J6LVF1_9ZZZZ